MAAHRPTQRRLVDIEDLLLLCAADLDVVMHPQTLSGPAREKLAYWLGRAWDAGHIGKDKPPVRLVPPDEG